MILVHIDINTSATSTNNTPPFLSFQKVLKATTNSGTSNIIFAINTTTNS